ncbi:choice-of-anchor G family protein [Microbacterium sp. PRF11]|uniref:choice-of-anchor G family protein n=1 Tax=Microbacterium sp. PRF11 TaxID=2962593 RepID=UPI0028828A51|nr:choice-of-anchor G family protein [Microbacterium sp. PRF11]MDT0115999.1 choice-of-anchor G family protein [Microbacterium sp. PRF11]
MGAASLSLFGGVTAANAAPGDESNATGTFLGGSILSLIDLDAIAEIEGAAATNDGTEPTVVDYNTLDLTALGVVNVTVPGGIQVPVDLGSLGVVGQYAEADPDGGSVGASGAVGSGGVIGTGAPATGPLNVSLGGAVDALAGSVAAELIAELADVDLTLDAVSARASLQATADGEPELVRDYTIAGGQLVIDSATLSDLTADLNAAVAGAQGTVDNVDTGLNSTLATLLGPLGGLVTANLSVSTTSLTDAIAGLLQGQLTSPEYPGVIIDLSTGEIIVDLDAIQPLNGLAPGTNILGSETVGEIGDAVAALVGGLVDDVNEALVDAVRGLSVTGGASVNLGLGSVNVLNVNTTVGALLDGRTTGVELVGIGLGLGGGVQGLVDGLTTPLETLLTNLGATVEAVAAPVTTLLTPALDEILPQLVTVTVNNQSEPSPGVFSETGVIVTILPGSIATTIELANATVGPNALDDNADVTIVSPEDGTAFVVPDADDVSDVIITGTGEIGAEITVSIEGQEDQVTTVGEGGTWTVTFPDLPVGEYTATATQDADGTTADVTFSVVEAPDVAILTPTPDQIIVVPGADDTSDVIVTGTGSPGSDVEVVIGDETQTVTVTPEGTWTATFEDLPIGDYTVTVTQEIDGSTDTVDFSIAETPDVVIEQPADGTEIAVGAADDVTTVTVSGTGSPGSTVTVELDNGAIEDTVVADNGEWTVTFEDLPIGDYTATALQDADGSTDTVDFSVVLATPVTITTPIDGTEYEVGEPDATRTVTVSGTGQAGAEIEVTLSNGDVETTTVLPSGLWSVTFDEVGVGEFTATAVQDIDGSSDSASFSISAAAADADAADVDVADADLVDADADAADADAADVDALDVLDIDVTDVLDALDIDADADVLDADADVADIDADADGLDLDLIDADALDIDILDADADVLDIDADGADADVADADALDVLDIDVTDVLDALDIDADADVLDADADVADIDADADGLDLDLIDADALDIDILDADADVLDIDADGADADVADADAVDVDALDVLDIDADGLDVADALDQLDIADALDQLDIADALDQLDIADALDQLDIADALDQLDIADALDQLDIADALDQLDIDAVDADATDADATDADATDVADADATDVADADATDADATDADAADADAADATDADAVDADATDSDATDGGVTTQARADVALTQIVRGTGVTQTVILTGFQPGETISATVNSTPFELTPVTADASGSARMTFAVGADFQLGAHRVDVRGSVSGELPTERENTAFTVTAQPVAAAGGGGKALPATGVDLNGPLTGGIAAALILAGATLWTLRRRSASGEQR